MKTYLNLCLFLILAFTSQVSAQIAKPYPIPSYNVIVTDPAAFQETGTSATKAKKDVIIQVKPGNAADSGSCGASVIIYSLDHQTILGPYFVSCGETVTVPIDEREWGVIVTADIPVEVSVWIEEVKRKEHPMLNNKEQTSGK